MAAARSRVGAEEAEGEDMADKVGRGGKGQHTTTVNSRQPAGPTARRVSVGALCKRDQRSSALERGRQTQSNVAAGTVWALLDRSLLLVKNRRSKSQNIFRVLSRGTMNVKMQAAELALRPE